MTTTLVLVGYLLGSIPFALLLGGAQVRRLGSGNLGAANVLRVRRTSIALTVLTLDVAKGCAAVLIASGVNASATTTAAVGGGAILGHVYPIWLRFKGGKGVATTFGVFTLLSPPPPPPPPPPRSRLGCLAWRSARPGIFRSVRCSRWCRCQDSYSSRMVRLQRLSARSVRPCWWCSDTARTSSGCKRAPSIDWDNEPAADIRRLRIWIQASDFRRSGR